ncbi:MAG: hypothetical protein ACFFAS_17030 [Promethearchaeota archaeon]
MFEKYSIKTKIFYDFASSKDAQLIVDIIKNGYDNTYPYKEMEDVNEVKQMIESRGKKFVLFKNIQGHIVGTIAFVFDFIEKSCCLRYFVVKKRFQGHVKISTPLLDCINYIKNKYQGDILKWWAEIRTSNVKIQYLGEFCGFQPYAFLPNKDIFNNKIESNILEVCYEEYDLNKHRVKKLPLIIKEILPCFRYSCSKHGLMAFKKVKPRIRLDRKRVMENRKKIRILKEEDQFGYEYIKFYIKDSESFLKFTYTPFIQNIEKTEYKIKNEEELFVFLEVLINFMEKNDVRYVECFVSAYEPKHQKMFLKTVFKPRGYLPSWILDKNENLFKDIIVFNSYKGEINKGIKLIKGIRYFLSVLKVKFK